MRRSFGLCAAIAGGLAAHIDADVVEVNIDIAVEHLEHEQVEHIRQIQTLAAATVNEGGVGEKFRNIDGVGLPDTDHRAWQRHFAGVGEAAVHLDENRRAGNGVNHHVEHELAGYVAAAQVKAGFEQSPLGEFLGSDKHVSDSATAGDVDMPDRVGGVIGVGEHGIVSIHRAVAVEFSHLQGVGGSFLTQRYFDYFRAVFEYIESCDLQWVAIYERHNGGIRPAAAATGCRIGIGALIHAHKINLISLGEHRAGIRCAYRIATDREV